jgi:hypothetical protein
MGNHRPARSRPRVSALARRARPELPCVQRRAVRTGVIVNPPCSDEEPAMRTKVGMCVLLATALILGVAKVSLLPAAVVWLVTAGTVYAVERLFSRNDKLTRK